MNKKESNTGKYILYAILGIFVVVIALPILGGVISGVNPSKSVEMANQKTMKNLELALPKGYEYITMAEKMDLGDEVIYVTKIGNGKQVISIIKQSTLPTCKGKTEKISELDVCKGVSINKEQKSLETYTWKANSGVYQLDIVAGSISDAELTTLMKSI